LYSKIDSDPFFSNEYKKNILIKYFQENNIDAKIENGVLPDTFRIHYNLKSQPKVSIFIPTKNNRELLQRCIDSIKKNTNYKNIEIIIINNPALPTEIYFDPKLEKYYDDIPHKVVNYEGNFNFSKMNNVAVKESAGDLLLFLNDDTKILPKSKDWLDEMVSILLQDDVGVVGPKLVFGDDTIQHAGMTFLKTGAGFHPFMKLDEDAKGYHNFANIMKECSAVTGACLLTTRDIFEQIGEFDEDFDVYYGDSDLCLKIRQAGYKVVYTPFSVLLHDGSRTIRGKFNFNYFAVESHQRFLEKWPELKNGDPFYHEMLDWDYSLPEKFDA
jgi:GT2 family glycosyltransferase